MSESIWIQGHMHSEPICAYPGCQTYIQNPPGQQYMVICFNCYRTPEEINEYVEMADEYNTSPRLFVIHEEGTYNPNNGHFCCTECYIRIGQPSSPQGWKAP